MSRRFVYLNFCGVLALAGLCFFQWHRDSKLNLDLFDSEKTRLVQEAKLAEQSNTLKSLNEDIGQFKTSMAGEQKERVQLEIKLKSVTATNELLSLECEQLKTSITNWMNAVTTRDQHIQEANAQIEKLSADLNASIVKFNALVTNYNAVVKDFDTFRAQSATNAPAK